MVIAADDVGYAHLMVVNHHRQIIGRGAVRPQEDQIVQIPVLEPDVALHLIGDQGLALDGSLQANHMRPVGRVIRREVPPGRANDPSFGASQCALRLQLVGGHVVAVGRTPCQHVVDRQSVSVCTARLEHRRFVDLET